MARICLEFLCFKDITTTAQSLIGRFDPKKELDKILNREWGIDKFLEDNNEVESFLVYASEYWHSHLQNMDFLNDGPLVNKILELYDTSGDLFNQWFPIFWKTFRRTEPRPTPVDELTIAAILGHNQVLKWFAKRRNSSDIDVVNDLSAMPLVWASRIGHVNVVEGLIDLDANINARAMFDTALYAASLNGHEPVVRLLLEANADADAVGGSHDDCCTPLQAASSRGHEQVVRLLLNAGTDVNVENNASMGPPLLGAVDSGDEKTIKLLLEAGANPDTCGGDCDLTPLYSACSYNQVHTVRLLLKAGANVNLRASGAGETPLFAAAERGFVEIMRLLLAAGADVEAKGVWHTPLYKASADGQEQA
ncbi:hypothetical protein LTR10_013477 [Elasticomyces elasticus]|nr:hypothetical protein LTR10_013477 [Elasticomyces elasticus]